MLRNKRQWLSANSAIFTSFSEQRVYWCYNKKHERSRENITNVIGGKD